MGEYIISTDMVMGGHYRRKCHQPRSVIKLQEKTYGSGAKGSANVTDLEGPGDLDIAIVVVSSQ